MIRDFRLRTARSSRALGNASHPAAAGLGRALARRRSPARVIGCRGDPVAARAAGRWSGSRARIRSAGAKPASSHPITLTAALFERPRAASTRKRLRVARRRGDRARGRRIWYVVCFPGVFGESVERDASAVTEPVAHGAPSRPRRLRGRLPACGTSLHCAALGGRGRRRPAAPRRRAPRKAARAAPRGGLRRRSCGARRGGVGRAAARRRSRSCPSAT